MSVSTPILIVSFAISARAAADVRSNAKATTKKRFKFVSLFSDPEIFVNLVEVPRQFRVADHLDYLAILDDVMPVGDHRRKAKILFDQQNRKPLGLQRFNDAADLLH